VLLNCAEVRREVFRRLEVERPHLVGKLTRVSPEFFERLDAQVVQLVIKEVRSLPTVGTTIR
jgi:hypothetical protein